SYFNAPGTDNVAGGHNGSLQGGLTTDTGKVGTYAFSFNGTDAYLQVPHSTAFNTNTLTLEAWVNPTTTTRTPAILTKINNTVAGGSSWGLFMVGGKLRLGVYNSDNTGWVYDSTNVVLTAGVWKHVAGTYNASTGQTHLYVNGVEVSTTQVDGHAVS